jgi:hypothetical protein
MIRSALVIAASAILVVTAPAAAQQQLCTERQVVLSQLSKQYAEAPVAMGVANNGGVLEILSSGAGKSWTIILTMPNGMTCMIAAGDSWEALPVMAQIDPPA